MLERLACTCVRHRWIVIGAWVAALVVIGGVSGAVGPDWRTDFVLPSGDARDVQDLLEANNPERAGWRQRSSSRRPRASTTLQYRSASRN